MVSVEPASQYNPTPGLPSIFITFSAASLTKFSLAVSVASRTDKQEKVTVTNTVLGNIKPRETPTKCLRFWKVA